MPIFNHGCGPCNRVPYTNIHDLNLDWILCTVQQLDQGFDALQKEVTEKLQELGVELEEVQKWISQFDKDEFVKYIKDTVDKYLTSGVYFGLTDSGYFVAYIPDGWKDIQFGTTGLDTFPIIEPEYGHLTLSY